VSPNWQILLTKSLPILIPLGMALIILVIDAFYRKKDKTIFMVLALIAVGASFYCAWGQWIQNVSWNQNLLTFDRLSYIFDLIFLFCLLITLLISRDHIRRDKIDRGDYYALLLFSLVGMMIIAHAGDIMALFLGIEVMTIAAYILAGMKKNNIKSTEAAVKYFVLGGVAAGLMVFGIAFFYGATGSTKLVIVDQSAQSIFAYLAVALILVGLCFKIAAVPFHFWSPDVYEGSPTTITAFMATAIKAAGFAALLRVLFVLIPLTDIPWVPILSALAIATMTVGNFIALKQTNIKRMLAYSSIAHAGYALVGLAAAAKNNQLSEVALGAVIFYMMAYAIVTLGAFAIVIAMGRRGDEAEEITDFSGLGPRHPLLAAAMTVFMIALTGIPPTIGFIGKFYLFASAMEAGLFTLVIIGVLNSVVSAYYYLGVVMTMYFKEDTDYKWPPLAYLLTTSILLTFLGTLYWGIFPRDLFLMAQESVKQIIF
jgi:NADH-quinone oxidoreductase subunit N